MLQVGMSCLRRVQGQRNGHRSLRSEPATVDLHLILRGNCDLALSHSMEIRYFIAV